MLFLFGYLKIKKHTQAKNIYLLFVCLIPCFLIAQVGTVITYNLQIIKYESMIRLSIVGSTTLITGFHSALTAQGKSNTSRTAAQSKTAVCELKCHICPASIERLNGCVLNESWWLCLS